MSEGLKERVPLKDHSTMRLGGDARYLCEIHDGHDIPAFIDWADEHGLPVIMIGSGSNIVWRDDGFPGVVMVNRISGFDVRDRGEHRRVTVGAGENWDGVVERSVAGGLSGIEQLSLIPGTAGATPIQNVGAYGREIADVLVCVRAYDRVARTMVVLPRSDCGLSYRSSRFKGSDKGRFFITSITLSLEERRPDPPFYAALDSQLRRMRIPVADVTAEIVRDAVIAIRREKLPDPAEHPNCGSFFHNPIVPMTLLEAIRETHPGVRYWRVGDDEAKVSAGWLLEQLGLRGYHDPDTGIHVWDDQALVFVNERATRTAQLLAFRDAVRRSVEDEFGIDLVQEPEVLP